MLRHRAKKTLPLIVAAGHPGRGRQRSGPANRQFHLGINHKQPRPDRHPTLKNRLLAPATPKKRSPSQHTHTAQDVVARYVIPQNSAEGESRRRGKTPPPGDDGGKLLLTIITHSLYRRYVCGPRASPIPIPEAQCHVRARCSSPTSSLLKSGHLDKACIISLDGSSVWATSTGFTVNTCRPSPKLAAIFRPSGPRG